MQQDLQKHTYIVDLGPRSRSLDDLKNFFLSFLSTVRECVCVLGYQFQGQGVNVQAGATGNQRQSLAVGKKKLMAFERDERLENGLTTV